MTIGLTDDKHYKAIANALRAELGESFTREMYPEEMSRSVSEACQLQHQHGETLGYNKGHEKGYKEGYEAGKAEGGGGDTEAAYQEGFAAGVEQGKRESYEMITITTSKSTALDVKNLFHTMLNDVEKHVIFSLMQNDASLMPNNQCTAFEIHFLDNAANGEPNTWSRYRDGASQSIKTISSDYDLVVTAGDVFKKVVLL